LFAIQTIGPGKGHHARVESGDTALTGRVTLVIGGGLEHAFAAKFRRYASGRWLVAIAGGRCFLF